MYLPTSFREERLEILHALIRAHPLATLITAGTGGLIANLVPFTLVETGNQGTLRAHIAQANDQVDALKATPETLVIFHGPEAYVTPSWYPSKMEHGRVVPTWNYVVVQVRGTPKVIDDPAWLRAQIADLTAEQENQRSEPWKVGDAPRPFIENQMRAIIGVEIPISSIEGKWKLSQNRSAADPGEVSTKASGTKKSAGISPGWMMRLRRSNLLLDRHGFGQVAGLVDIATATHGNVVRQQLERNDFNDGRQDFGRRWNMDHVLHQSADCRIAFCSHCNYAA